jgi:hypothetical protein
MHHDAEIQYQYFVVICYVIRHESVETGTIFSNNKIDSERPETEDMIWLKLAQHLVQWQAFIIPILPMLDPGILLQ